MKPILLRCLPAIAAAIAMVIPCSADKTLETASGTYTDALRKAGEAGKPVMLYFWNANPDCKRQWAQLEEIPEALKKFVVYPVNEQNRAVSRKFGVVYFPTVVLIKPDGTEIFRWHGLYTTPGEIQQVLEAELRSAGPIAKLPKVRSASSDTTAKGAAERQAYETAAGNELKMAMNKLNLGRKTEASKAFKQIVSKYPGSEAAKVAEEQLAELEPESKER